MSSVGKFLLLLIYATKPVLIKKVAQNKQDNSPRNMGQLKQIDVNATSTARQDPNAVQLPVIVVNAEQNSYTVNNIQAGSKLEQDLKDIPRSISVLSRQQLDDQGITRLDGALEQLGVVITPNDAISESGPYSSRSFALDNINIDGSATKTFTNLATASETMDTGLSKYENVQLLRGPDGLFSGNGQPSGSINLVRKRPTRDLQVITTTAIGSWNNYRGEIDVSSPLNNSGHLRGRAVASYQGTEKFYSNERQYLTLYGIIEADILENTQIRAGVSYDEVDGTGRDSAPQFPRYSNGDLLPISTKLGYPNDTLDVYDSLNIFVGAEHQFNSDWRSKFNVSMIKSSSNRNLFYYRGAVDPNTGKGSFFGASGYQDLDSDAISTDFNIQGHLDLWGHENKLVFGADYVNTQALFKGTTGRKLFYNGQPVTDTSIDWNTFDYTRISFADKTAFLTISDIDVTQKGTYLYNSFAILEPLKLIIGGRLATYERKRVNLSPTTGLTSINAHSKSKSNFIPYYALQYDFLPDWTAYLTMTEGYEDQSRLYTPNYKPIDPMTTVSYEFGIKGEHFDGKLNSNITLYRSKRDNLAVSLYADPDFALNNPGQACCYVGGGKWLGEGVEFDISGELLPNLQANIGYTYDNSTTEYGTNQGKRLNSQAPKHIFRAWGRYQFSGALEKLILGGGVKAQSDFYKEGTVKTWNPTGGEDGTGAFDGPATPYQFTESGRAIWDAFAQYKINSNWSATLNINNVFDKRYLQVVGDTARGNMYGTPRNFLLTLRAKY